MAYTLPELPYAYEALEPHIDAETMQKQCIFIMINTTTPMLLT